MTQAAPLISIPQSPAPKGGAAEWFTGHGGLRLRGAIFPAAGAARGSVVLSPGRTEPLEKYFEVIGELQGRDFTVLIHDWRGQGLSARMLKDRLRGHGWRPSEYMADYQALLDHFQARLPRPWVQMGHSMGGCLSLLALAMGERRFVASALSAPMLGIVTDNVLYPFARALTFTAAHLGGRGRYLFGDPAPPFKPTFESDRITHDRQRWDRFRAMITAAPDLALGNITWGWLEFAMRAAAYLRRPSVLEKVDIPMLIVGAGEDDRVITAVTRRAAARLPDCRYVEAPGAYHEILMETDDIRDLWWREFDALLGRVPALRSPSV